MADYPEQSPMVSHARHLDWREAEERARPVVFRPGDLNWRMGFEHALRQAAGLAEARSYTVQHGAAVATPECEAMRQLATDIRNMKPEAPR